MHCLLVRCSTGRTRFLRSAATAFGYSCVAALSAVSNLIALRPVSQIRQIVFHVEGKSWRKAAKCVDIATRRLSKHQWCRWQTLCSLSCQRVTASRSLGEQCSVKEGILMTRVMIQGRYPQKPLPQTLLSAQLSAASVSCKPQTCD